MVSGAVIYSTISTMRAQTEGVCDVRGLTP